MPIAGFLVSAIFLPLQYHPSRPVWSGNAQCACGDACSVVVLALQAALGSGSEMVVDVGPGVDWTAMVAILMAVQQVGPPRTQ